MKFLGVFLGNDIKYREKNLENLLIDTEKVLQKLKHIVKGLSYKGRALIVNQLSASKLWHKFACLEPPPLLVDDLQRKFNTFFWQGMHWITAKALYCTYQSPIVDKVLYVKYVKSKLFDFRIKLLKSFVYSIERHSCFTFVIFKCIGNLCYDTQLLQI